jgi:hypothetical protein
MKEEFTYGIYPDGRTGLKNKDGEAAFPTLNAGRSVQDIETFVNLRQDLKRAQSGNSVNANNMQGMQQEMPLGRRMQMPMQMAL